MPPRVFRSVLLPEPLGPMIAMSSPFCSFSEVGSSSVFEPTCTSTSRASSGGASNSTCGATPADLATPAGESDDRSDTSGSGEFSSAPHASQNRASCSTPSPQLVQNELAAISRPQVIAIER